jgi:SAM-dependent methyltransferase
MTIVRRAEYNVLSGVTLSGSVLDLGGERRSEYHPLFKGDFSVTTVNIQGETHPDIIADLEKPLPIADASYDAVLLINVLEHIFEYRTLVAESARVMKPGGIIIIVVPFLFPVHPSPHDYHRYTNEALEIMLMHSGFSDIRVKALGTGVFATRFAMLERLFPKFLEPLLTICGMLAGFCDAIFAFLARMAGKKYRTSDYPLGYLATARKH